MQSLREVTRTRTTVGDESADRHTVSTAGEPSLRSRRGTSRRQPRPLSSAQFRERLLSIMDRKHHWAWTVLTGPGINRAQLRIHFQNEYATYVRDFPVLLARIHGRNPPTAVRRMLAENIYEEDTGGLSFGRSHPELFLRMMKGLGYSEDDFEDIRPLPAARAYRNWLDRITSQHDWVRAAAAMAIFVEGSVNDRREILHASGPRTNTEIEQVVRQHFLVRHHGLSTQFMDLTRAHQRVESGHRHDAYAMVMAGATDRRHQQAVIACVEKALTLWLRYRDAVADACGLRRPA